ncbi:MAG: hypothetical protein ACM3SU_11310 [Acidobacteriota bacterium]|jgi:hypothetical protein
MNPRHPQDYQLHGTLTIEADHALRELAPFVNDYVLKRADELAKYGEILREHVEQAVREEKASGRLKR